MDRIPTSLFFIIALFMLTVAADAALAAPERPDREKIHRTSAFTFASEPAAALKTETPEETTADAPSNAEVKETKTKFPKETKTPTEIEAEASTDIAGKKTKTETPVETKTEETASDVESAPTATTGTTTQTSTTPATVRRYAYAKKADHGAGTMALTLRELGVLQLAAHDLFDVDRDEEIDKENGKLDLSTLLEHGEEFIALGGEPRNRENIFMFSVARDYGLYYLELIDGGRDEDKAYQQTLRRYHRELGRVYYKLFGENLPQPTAGEVTMTENLALRTIHDFLPAEIVMNRQLVDTLNPDLLGQHLSTRDLKQQASPLDGKFDEEFLDVTVIIPPDDIRHIDLFERDESFGEQFGATHTFSYFMDELSDGSYDEGEVVTEHIKELFAKGLYLEQN